MPDPATNLDPRTAVSRHPLTGQIGQRLAGPCGVPVGSHLVVGCSGGADSVALLLAFCALQRRASGSVGRVTAVHVHHHLRDDADDDARFVAELCDRWSIPFERRDVHPDASIGNLSAVARDMRYDALRGVAHSVSARFIATAHHGDDQLETMIMALCRGAGLAGLSGMRWSTPIGPEPIQLVRPLLDSPRTACESLCEAAAVQWRDDPTNANPDLVRGRLRRDVMPVLNELWPGAAVRVNATADIVASAAEHMEQTLAARFGPPEQRTWDRSALRLLPAPIIAAGLRRAAIFAVGESDRLGQRQLKLAAEAITWCRSRPRVFDWPHGMQLSVRSRQVHLTVK